jgi:hypothetical protein
MMIVRNHGGVCVFGPVIRDFQGVNRYQTMQDSLCQYRDREHLVDRMLGVGR